MLDAKTRQALTERLRGKVKKASSNISTRVESENGDYKITITADSIIQSYKGQEVGRIRVAELDDEVLAFINTDSQEATQEMLNEFMQSFDHAAFERTASSKTEVKEAANAALDSNTAQMVTEKQLNENKVKLHPRKEEFYNNVTQKQLPEHGQRPGTYEQITEAQFANERTTFYGANRVNDWKDEDRNVVTEGQLDAGIKEYSEVATIDRGEIGSEFDGGISKQHKMTGEKQLAELLKHHEWTEPLTITEGKDQLGKQDGDLARISAEVAEKIIKESLNAMGKTVLATGTTPDQLATIVKQLVSHDSKLPALANTIGLYANSDTQAIDRKVAKAQHFGKTANTAQDWSNTLIADVLVRQFAKLAYNPAHIVEGLVALASQTDMANRINQAADEVAANKTSNVKESESKSIFKKVLEAKNTIEGTDDDGMYAYAGALSEVDESPDNREKFAHAAAEVGKKQIIAQLGREITLTPDVINVDKAKGQFEVTFKDASKVDATLETRAQRRREMAKKAQVGGAGGMAPAAGPQMGNAAPPPAVGDMNAPPPGEALSQEPPAEEEGMGESGSGEPKPPGSFCLSCKSEDVDVDGGKIRCNNCGASGTVSVKVEMDNWPGVVEDTKKGPDEEEGFGLGETDGIGAEEDSMAGEGSGTTLPNIPVGASVRITHLMLEKLAEKKIPLGSICPNCSSQNTDVVKSASRQGYDGVCLDCYQTYNFKIQTIKDKKNQVYANYKWMRNRPESDCLSCTRDSSELKQAFVDSLNNYGMEWDAFHKLSMKAKGEVIVKMARVGALDIADALKKPLPMQKLAASARWKGTEQFDKFPSASCMEKLSRRYGENATSMSGPCQGKKLADCVCRQLENLGIYSDGLAAKVAAVQKNADPMINSPMKTCINMFVKDGFDVEDACVACDGLRAAYANNNELVIEAIAQLNPMAPRPMKAKPMVGPGAAAMPAPKPMMAPAAPKPMASPATGGAPAPMGDPKPMMDAQPAGGGAPMPAAPMAKPMEDGMDPAGVSIELEQGFGPESGGLGDDMGGPDMGMDDGFGGLEGDMDMGGEALTIKLPLDLADALEETLVILQDALKGNIGDDMIEENPLDVSDVTEDVVNGDDGAPSDEKEEGDSEIPGLMDDSSSELNKEGDEPSSSEGSDDSKPEGDSKPPFESSDKEEKHEESDKPEKDESKEMQAPSHGHHTDRPHNHAAAVETSSTLSKEAEANKLDQLLYGMKRSTIKKQSTAIDNIFEGLYRQSKLAAKGSDIKKVEYKDAKEGKIKNKPAQDAKEIGKIQDGGKLGHETKFTDGVKEKPDVPRSDALMGDEGKEMKVNETSDRPSVPHGSALMNGEEHYKPEKGDEVDGNQGASKIASKIVKSQCNCKGENCDCSCGHKACGAPCKTATSKKTSSTMKVPTGHKQYDAFAKKAASGAKSVKLADGNEYDITVDNDKTIILTAKKALPAFIQEKIDAKKNKDKDKDGDDKKCADSKELKKESQTVSPKSVEKLEDDPDLNPSSGPGAGKTHADKPHSLAVDEKKPSEGMNSPDVPEAPNGGRLQREHTVEKATDGPEIPAGGGMNPDYDQNEKNKPEKLDQTLGKDNGIAMASRDAAIKIAGQLLKANLITVDELPSKVNELAKASPEILKDYEQLIRKSSTDASGMKKSATAGTVENPVFVNSGKVEKSSELKSNIQSLFKLNQRNEDHERYISGQGDLKLYR